MIDVPLEGNIQEMIHGLLHQVLPLKRSETAKLCKYQTPKTVCLSLTICKFLWLGTIDLYDIQKTYQIRRLQKTWVLGMLTYTYILYLLPTGPIPSSFEKTILRVNMKRWIKLKPLN